MSKILTTFFLLVITFSATGEQILYNFEMLFFKHKPELIKHHADPLKIYRLPYLDPIQTEVFLIEDYLNRNSLNINEHSKLHLYVNWLEKSNYTIINYSNSQSENPHQDAKLFFTNQEPIIESIQEDSFEQLRYVSRGYIDNLSTNPLLVSLALQKTNNTSTYLSIRTNYITTNSQDFLIKEKRKINFGEINYFDNLEYGVFIVISKYETDDDITEPHESDQAESHENDITEPHENDQAETIL